MTDEYMDYVASIHVLDRFSNLPENVDFTTFYWGESSY